MLTQEVAAQARKPAVLAGALARGARSTIEKDPAVAAAQELVGIARRMDEHVDVGVRVGPDGRWTGEFQRRARGRDARSPNGARKWVGVEVAAAEIHEIPVVRVDGDREVVIALAAVVVDG